MRTLVLREGGAFYFLIVMENKVADLKINGYVMLPLNYPKQVPLIAVSVMKTGGKEMASQTFTTANSYIVKALETYVNITCINKGATDVDSLLTRQLANLVSRCDVIADLVPQLNNGNSQKQHLYSRTSREVGISCLDEVFLGEETMTCPLRICHPQAPSPTYNIDVLSVV
ncbi:unnamed protein product [Strongylus vulgaris]|uniref:Uncharacterized protein n=1 Tax=Strongylus vulgaris TaxID=40348 RepID=A0A3P7J046_STRVU|nr:unnamed protein product [Strongylus vulgaris]